MIISGGQKINPFLWFNTEAQEAAKFYISVFSKREGESKILSSSPMIVEFLLSGQKFMAINGGPTHANFTEAISFLVNCETQEEVDYFWKKLSKGGKESRCGWLKDRYGLSWQIVPTILGKLMNSGGKEKSQKVMEAILKMDKIIVDDLRKAYDGN